MPGAARQISGYIPMPTRGARMGSGRSGVQTTQIQSYGNTQSQRTGPFPNRGRQQCAPGGPSGAYTTTKTVIETVTTRAAPGSAAHRMAPRGTTKVTRTYYDSGPEKRTTMARTTTSNGPRGMPVTKTIIHQGVPSRTSNIRHTGVTRPSQVHGHARAAVTSKTKGKVTHLPPRGVGREQRAPTAAQLDKQLDAYMSQPDKSTLDRSLNQWAASRATRG